LNGTDNDFKNGMFSPQNYLITFIVF